MKNIYKNRPGVALAEALVAVATLAIGAVVLSTIISNAYSTNTTSRDYLVAQNLVTEGVEIVKNIRDTNWLLRPSDKGCWRVAGPSALQNPSQDCHQLESVLDGSNYTINSSSGIWGLNTVPGNQPLDLTGSSSNEQYRLFIPNQPADFYYTSTVNSSPSEFYRSVKFIDADDTYAVFEVKVQWMRQRVRDITRKVTIYNYL